ncbi:UvrD-helicase domain-containing protein [Brevibacterium casei]|uniref:UvrD-helicase domain-containing protein n=1 Tax=Brevibacterium casei TaxID=33889 RepID=UPI003158B4A9
MSITLHKNMSKMEKSIKGKAMEFLMKLDADPTSSGLHIEPIQQSADRRFRTGRVDKFWRAVLFKLVGKSGVSWVVYGVYPHDDAIKLARNLKLDVNPTNGVTEITLVDKVDDVELQARMAESGSSSGPATGAPAVASSTTGEHPVGEAAHDGASDTHVDTIAPDSTVGASAFLADPVFGDKPLADTLGRVSDDLLISELGVWQTVAKRARQCRSVDELLEALEAINAPEWQSDALLDLASGTSYADVVEKLFAGESQDAGPTVAERGSSTSTGDVVTASGDSAVAGPVTGGHDAEIGEDDAIIAGLRTSAAQLSFAEIDGEDELKRVAEGGDFEAWRVFLHPEQRRWAQRGYNGPFRLSGGAGTGKTVVLVHRAVRLAKTPPLGTDPAPRVVLTTFTRNLASDLESQVSTLDKSVPRAGKLGNEGLYVAGVDQLAFEVLKNAGTEEIAAASIQLLGRAHQNLSARSDDSDWDQALGVATDDYPERARNRVFLKDEYEQVVLPNRLTTKADYMRVRRPDRGVRLSRQQRALVWDVFEAYRARTATNDSLSWEEVSHLAAVVLHNRAHDEDNPGSTESERRSAYLVDHLLVDEGQDLHAGHWMFLRALVRPGRDDLFIGEDSHQRIYGTKVVLSKFGISIVGRSRRLTLNYRTTEQNLAFGLGILAGGDFTDLEDSTESVTGYRSLRTGQPPTVRGFSNLDEELDFVASALKAWLDQCEQDPTMKPEQIAVLVRSDPNKAARRLGELGVTVQQVGKGIIHEGSPVAMTMHRAKGTEFRNVVVMHAGQQDLPSGLTKRLQPEEYVGDFNLRERSLLYVATTRARDRVVVTYS